MRLTQEEGYLGEVGQGRVVLAVVVVVLAVVVVVLAAQAVDPLLPSERCW